MILKGGEYTNLLGGFDKGVLRVRAGGEGGVADLGGLEPASSSPTSSTSTSTSSSSRSVRGESGQGECEGDLLGLLDTGEPTRRPTPNDRRSEKKITADNFKRKLQRVMVKRLRLQ